LTSELPHPPHHFALITALVVVAALLATALAPASAPARPLVTGVTLIGGEETGFQRIRHAGARFVRLTIFWSDVAPSSEPPAWNPSNPADPNYNWRGVDRAIKAAVKANLTPLVQIYNAPPWAERCDSEGPNCDIDPQAFATFSRAAAARYSGAYPGLPRIRYWQALNEPNLDLYFNPQFRGGRPVAPVLYRTLINAFAAAVKSVHRSNRIVGPGLAPLEVEGFGLGPLEFTRRLLCMRGRHRPRPAKGCTKKTRFDVWATNPYTTGGPTHEAAGPDDVSLGDLPEMRRLLRAAERAGHIRSALHPVPFWVTEFSWDSRPPDPGGLRWRIHARWAAEAIYRAWHAGVTTFFWLGLRDRAVPAGTPSYLIEQSGLYLRGPTLAQDRPKRVLRAFRFPFVAFRSRKGIRVWGRTPSSGPGKVKIQVGRGKRWRRIAVLRADRNGIFGKVLRTRFGRNKRGLVRAGYRRQKALPFSLHYVGDFYAPPFGLAPGQSHVPQRRRLFVEP
jgi:hypothetical protein